MKDSVLVLGGKGFLGTVVTKELQKQGFKVTDTEHLKARFPGDSPVDDDKIDLLTPGALELYLKYNYHDIVLHLAGKVGGLKTNLDKPAEMFYENTMMGLNVLEGFRKSNSKKLVSIVASCGYSEYNNLYLNDVMKEDSYFQSPPNRTVACHGYAKRNLQLATSYYRKQYSVNAVCLCPTTVYGPGQDYSENNSKIVGAMVKRFVDAAESNKPEIICWGTGEPFRELIYVDDASKLILKAMFSYDNSDIPLNIGSGQELSVKELAMMVAKHSGYNGVIKWDNTKSDGQFRKRLDLTRMNQYLGKFAFMPLEVGIKNCVEDYKHTMNKQRI